MINKIIILLILVISCSSNNKQPSIEENDFSKDMYSNKR